MPDGFEESFLPPPPEFEHAPTWAVALWYQSRRDFHRSASALMVLEGRVLSVEKKLGEEPDVDGRGGKGLIGEVRSLTALKTKGLGFLAAIMLSGALLIQGVIHWVQQVAQKLPAVKV